MSLNPKKLLIVGAGALCSALVVIMLLNAALRPAKEEKVAEAPKDGIEVMIAAKDLKPGDILDDKMVKWEEWDENRVYSGLVMRQMGDEKAEVTGKIKRAVVTGEPVTDGAMVSDKDASMMVAQLKPGMRAIGIKVTAESSAGGFISPGDHVDVILSHQIKVKANSPEADMAVGLVDKNVSETILQNLQILAVDQESEKGDSAKVGHTATLAVTPKQAEILLLAGQMGDLSLTLRGLSDEEDAKAEKAATKDNGEMTTDVQVSRVLGRLNSQNEAGGPVKNVRIYNSVAVDSRVYAIVTRGQVNNP